MLLNSPRLGKDLSTLLSLLLRLGELIGRSSGVEEAPLLRLVGEGEAGKGEGGALSTPLLFTLLLADAARAEYPLKENPANTSGSFSDADAASPAPAVPSAVELPPVPAEASDTFYIQKKENQQR